MNYSFIMLFIFVLSSFCGEFPSPNKNNKVNVQDHVKFLCDQIVPKTREIFDLDLEKRLLQNRQNGSYKKLVKIAKKHGIPGEQEFDECDRPGAFCEGDEAWSFKVDCYKANQHWQMDFCAKYFAEEIKRIAQTQKK